MRLFALLIASLTLLACGGSVPAPNPPDAATDAATQDGATVPPDASPEADAPECVCVGANNGTLMCGGVQRPDAESCVTCGGHCNSTDGG